MKEVWAPIRGYDNRYAVSNMGRILSLRFTPKIIKPRVHNGYYRIQFKKGGAIHDFAVHRLVAEAFILHPLGKDHIDHIDGNPKNNNASNLRWCTPKENANNPISLQRKKDYFSKHPTLLGKHHSEETKKRISEFASKRVGEKNSFYGKHHSDETKRKIAECRATSGISVSQFSMDGEFIKTWQSARVAARALGISSPSSVTECCRGKRRSIGGYKWKYTQNK